MISIGSFPQSLGRKLLLINPATACLLESRFPKSISVPGNIIKANLKIAVKPG